MSESVTVPASVFNALGELVEGDPPIAYKHKGAYGFIGSFGPGFGTPYLMAPRGFLLPSSEILLPASSPALLRVLARHLGMRFEPWEMVPLFHSHYICGWGMELASGCHLFPADDPATWGMLPGTQIPGVRRRMTRDEALVSILVRVADLVKDDV